jgi:Transposase DDE domain
MPEFEYAQRQRKKVEALFAELKSHIGLHRLRLRRLKFVQEQFLLASAAQNIKRLVRFLGGPTLIRACITGLAVADDANVDIVARRLRRAGSAP